MKTISSDDSELKIIIPTYNRELAEQHVFYHLIPKEFKDRTYFVVREEKLDKMKESFPDAQFITIPSGSVTCLANTRQWILDNVKFEKIWCVDDKVTIFQKRTQDLKIRGVIRDFEFIELYNLLSNKLNEYCYVGLSDRFYNNLKKTQFKENANISSCFAYRRSILKENDVHYDLLVNINSKATLYEDICVTIKLLLNGYKNLILNEFVYHFKGGHGQTGGNYGLRSAESSVISANLFKNLFPEFSIVKDSKGKTYWSSDDNHVDIKYQHINIRWNSVYKHGCNKILQNKSLF